METAADDLGRPTVTFSNEVESIQVRKSVGIGEQHGGSLLNSIFRQPSQPLAAPPLGNTQIPLTGFVIGPPHQVCTAP